MFGPYEINLDGRVLHGNVDLKEYRIIERDGDCFLLRVDEMAAAPIAPALARLLERWVPCPGTLIPEQLMQALRAANLVVEDTQHYPEATPADAALQESDSGEERPAPGAVANLSLFLAQDCNLACSYCYGQGGAYGGGGLMSADTARKAVDWLMANSRGLTNIHVGFFGGEPLLNLRVLKETVHYTKEQAAQYGKKVSFGITTNGTLLDEETVAYLVQETIEPLVSCDGPAEIHNRQRPFKNGGDSHAAVVTGAQRLLAAFPKVMARATVCGDTDPFVVRRGLEEVGFAHFSLTPASPVLLDGARADEEQTAREAAVGRMLKYRRQDIAEVFSAIAEQRLDAEHPPEVLVLLSGLATGDKQHFGCGVGRGMRGISVDGGIYPCHRFVGLEAFRMGALDNYSSEGLNDYHRAVVENLPECRSCWARYFCGGGCFYENRGRTGDMRRPDPLFCRDVRTLQEDLIAGWCRLSDQGRTYVRDLLNEKMHCNLLP